MTKTLKIAGAAVALATAALMTAPSHAAKASAAKAKPDIVETAMAAGSFDTLVTALQAAGLVDALKGDGPFTVFAPTDDAFAKLPPGTLDSLLADKEKLAAVLAYHVVPGKLMATDVAKQTSAKTLQGKSVRIATDGGVKIDGANVIRTDIETSNGVIHVIDTVIVP
jgi:uncharacterized surface protein with fasciclin (FAS1) repeats